MLRFFFVQQWSEIQKFGELFNSLEPSKTSSEDGEEDEPVARSKAEFIRRFVNKEKKNIAIDWLAYELKYINMDSFVISYKDALDMKLEDFLYIVRSNNKFNQLRNEQIEASIGK